MVARDDSVIRGSLIACMILLVLSLALNFFFWRWGDTQSRDLADTKSQVTSRDDQIRNQARQIETFEEILGISQMSDDKFNTLVSSETGDPKLNQIYQNFVDDMALLGADLSAQDRNYHAMPDLLITAIRSGNKLYGDARADASNIRKQAESDVANAQAAQKQAEKNRDAADTKLADEVKLFTEDRTRMNREKEETRDELSKTVRSFNSFRKKASDETTKLTKKTKQLSGTIETQRKQLTLLRSDQFETTQGLVRFVMQGGNVCTINLGSADALRPGVTFGVIDADETRLQDAKIKATLQVTKIRGQHLAEARVVARPEISSPIIEDDKIYSPFWAPGQTVKIALAGDIDIDGDGRPDNEQVRGMITSAGAEVAATIGVDGTETGKLDASIRFLVIGEDPDLSKSNVQNRADKERAIATIGLVRERANELGLTTIPAWKLQAYLKTIDDSVTTPLGSAARAEDFGPVTNIRASRLPTDLPQIYRTDDTGIQKDNNILRP